MILTLAKIKEAYKKKGYTWFEDKVNIGGIRTNKNDVDRWNDFIFIEHKGVFHIFQGTTRPGKYWLQHPMRDAGTFVMVPEQYIDCWKKGMHSGYPALVQCKPIKGWRDSDKDEIVDPDKTKIYTDGQNVDIHHAHQYVKQVVIDKYSAGCQVICDFSDWQNFFEIYSEAMQEFYSYTLIEENDLA
jgi:hypothetical protein